MAVQIERVTREAFHKFIHLPENQGRRFEYIRGEIVEVVSNNYASEIAAAVLAEVGVFARRNKLGRVTGADGGYIVNGDQYIPDVAYISFERQPEPCHDAYNVNPPDLAVEVIFNPQNQEEQRTLRIKLSNYLAAGVVVWVIDPEEQRVEVHKAGQPPQTLGLDDTLDGGDVLPGFTLQIKGIFIH